MALGMPVMRFWRQWECMNQTLPCHSPNSTLKKALLDLTKRPKEVFLLFYFLLFSSSLVFHFASLPFHDKCPFHMLWGFGNLRTWKDPYDTVSYLFGFHTIDNRVHSGRQEQVNISHNDVARGRNYVTSKSMGKETKEGWTVGKNNGTDVGSTGAEGLLPSIRWGEADHRP